MGKVNHRKLEKKHREALDQQLRAALGSAGVPVKTIPLIIRLLLPSEAVMIARRIQIARRLLAGDSFDVVRRDLGVGWSTIEQVHRWLEEDMKGYQEILQSARLEERPSSDKKSPVPYTFLWLRKKYPSRMLLFNLLFGDPFSK